MARTSRHPALLGLPLAVVVVVSILWRPVGAAPQSPANPAPAMTCGAVEEFLRTAKIGRKRDSPAGVTLPSRATLDSGTLQHEASIQTVDASEAVLQTERGPEQNFRDTWKFNVAGYELAKMLQLNMVPPYVERKVNGESASISWWIDNAMMERDRDRRKIIAPDIPRWVIQGLAANVFHELIYDTDSNKTNILITPQWRMWLIDFSRAFRTTKALLNPKMLVMCDRKLLANLRGLTEASLKEKLGRYLGKWEIEGVVARRDLIVKLFDKLIAEKGEAEILYDLPQMNEPCGTGLQ